MQHSRQRPRLVWSGDEVGWNMTYCHVLRKCQERPVDGFLAYVNMEKENMFSSGFADSGYGGYLMPV